MYKGEDTDQETKLLDTWLVEWKVKKVTSDDWQLPKFSNVPRKPPPGQIVATCPKI
jgi:hypothetical protein